MFLSNLTFLKFLDSLLSTGDRWRLLGMRRTQVEQVAQYKKTLYSRGTLNSFIVLTTTSTTVSYLKNKGNQAQELHCNNAAK